MIFVFFHDKIGLKKKALGLLDNSVDKLSLTSIILVPGGDSKAYL
jgi:hypothetical protein